ncbi:MAG: response regulator transcription factor [Clostridiales bacterium]|jgi:DNA-binding response OmpR family regulator|nr:response regulator transcription factor [Clostridiales bacterium]MDY4655716.1 response regulator transcription factor [Eubacteriales bacterium]
MNILLVEDEVSLSEALVHILKKEKYIVDAVYDGESGYEYAATDRYDLILLDVMLPKMNGFDVLRKLRTEKNNTPVIMLTALSQVNDKVRGLDMGADDYLAKPFSTPELLARIRAVSRRKTNTISENVKKFGDVEYNVSSFELCCNNKKVKVALKESEILQYFFDRPNFVVSKDDLIVKLWGYDSEAEYNNIEVYISFLRKKLAFIGSHVTISTVRGVGYKLEE